MPSQISLTEDQVQGLSWEVIEVTEDFRRSRAVYGTTADGTPVYAYRKEILAPEGFLEANRAERNATEGQRWGLGSGSEKDGNIPMIKVASTPLNVWYRDFAGRAGDQDFKRWWLKQTKNAPFRTRGGNI